MASLEEIQKAARARAVVALGLEEDCRSCKGRGSNMEPSPHEWIGGSFLVECAPCRGTGKRPDHG